jgi:hypothetical protein
LLTTTFVTTTFVRVPEYPTTRVPNTWYPTLWYHARPSPGLFAALSMHVSHPALPPGRSNSCVTRSSAGLSRSVTRPVFRPVCRARVSPGLSPVFHDRSLGLFSARSVELVYHPVFRRSFTIGHSACFPPGLSNTYLTGLSPGRSPHFHCTYLTRLFPRSFAALSRHVSHPAVRPVFRRTFAARISPGRSPGLSPHFSIGLSGEISP